MRVLAKETRHRTAPLHSVEAGRRHRYRIKFYGLMNWMRNLFADVRRGIAYLGQQNQLEILPVVGAVRGYQGAQAGRDLRAGINTALLTLPQGMAYAYIAGFPIQYGIYGSAVAAVVGPMFSGSRFIMMGPTNATSVLLFTSFLALEIDQSEKLALLPLLLFMIGGYLVIGAFFRVGNLIQYVSRTVVTGYLTAAALNIVVNQIRNVLGTNFEIPEGTTFFGLLLLSLESVRDAHLLSVGIALATGGAFVLLQKKLRLFPNVAICMVFGSLMALGFKAAAPQIEFLADWHVGNIQMLTPIDASSWALTIPPLSAVWVSQLAGTALILAFLCILEGASIGKPLAAQAGERFNVNQEMFGMGMANMACALCSGMPASGSLGRSKLNAASGAATPLASIFCGLFCGAVALSLGSFTRFIPQPVLGVLVMATGLSIISRFQILIALKATRSDAIVFATTFLAALLIKLEFGIILGTITSILLFLNKAAVPELVEYTADESGQLTPLSDDLKRPDPQVSIVHVEGALFFGAAELFRDQMRRVVEDPNLKIVVMKMRNAHHLDATSVLALMELVESMHEHDRHLLVSEARKPVIRVFKNSGLIEVIGRENIFADAAHNPTLSTAKALRRAKEILGGKKTKVSIYAGKRGTSEDSQNAEF